MKKVLSLLLAFVFLQVESWALSGGPVFGSGAATSFLGTYSGVLIPQTAPTVGSGSSTSLGLFSLSQPDVGVATGALVVFVNGSAFNGNIIGIIDAGSGALRAVIDATSTFSVTLLVPSGFDQNGNPTFTTEQFDVSAQGSMDAQVLAGAVSTGGFGAATTSSPSRIVGQASLDVFFRIANDGTPEVTRTETFDVDGFKQSESFSSGTTFTFGNNAG